MKKILLFCAVTCLCSCSTYKLANTVWYNVTPIELYGEKCNVVTSLYFWDGKTVNINTSLIQDSIMLSPAVLTASGTYESNGNLKKGVNIKLNVTNTKNQQETYQGLIKPQGMVLVSPDSIAKAYNKILNVSLIPSKK